jgi:DNA polymerase
MLKVPRNKVNVWNIICCRPPNNRDPSEEEVAACIPFLHKKIAVVKPDLIVALGKVSFLYLTGYETSVVVNHGMMMPYLKNKDIDVLLTFHPAFIIRPFGAKHKKSFIEDINNALKYCDLK